MYMEAIKMKIVVVVARVLPGLMFVFFGLNGFLNFLPAPALTGVPGAFLGALITSHYVYLVCAVQVLGGLLLLVNQFVPLGLALLAPVIANIVTYHLTMQKERCAACDSGDHPLGLSGMEVSRLLRAPGYSQCCIDERLSA
jgi:putative oxidoreductase